MTIEKAKSFHDKIKVTDKHTVSDGWLQSNKQVPVRIWKLYFMFNNVEYLIVWHLSNSVSARLKEFYCTA
jgi:hypothetical protein